MITKETIMEAYLFLRKENMRVPSETLEFMKDTALTELQKREVKNLGIHSVSGSYYYLKKGDEIQTGDEYQEQDGDLSWRKTGQIGKKYNPSKHYKHRRLK